MGIYFIGDFKNSLLESAIESAELGDRTEAERLFDMAYTSEVQERVQLAMREFAYHLILLEQAIASEIMGFSGDAEALLELAIVQEFEDEREADRQFEAWALAKEQELE